MKFFIYFLIIFSLISCKKSKNSRIFINTFEGRYFFNSNEILEVHFENDILKVFWRGKNMTPIKANDSSFYLKEMNEKLIFISKPKVHISLAKKREHNGEVFYFSKLIDGEKTAMEYFNNEEYSKALEAFIAIKNKDSLDSSINQRNLNSIGYKYLRTNKLDKAKEIFNINITLHPRKSDVYDSMGDVFRIEKDTLNAIKYYQKSLTINPENKSSLRNLKKLKKDH